MVTRKYDQIDSLRFLAVFGVLSAHWSLSIWDFLNKITIAGRGVDLFFAISGFLITLGLIRAKESNVAPANSLYKFYIRRALRIFPLYYLTVFILFCFYWSQVRLKPRNLLRHL